MLEFTNVSEMIHALQSKGYWDELPVSLRHEFLLEAAQISRVHIKRTDMPDYVWDFLISEFSGVPLKGGC